jgi:phytoene/squalene synthetase
MKSLSECFEECRLLNKHYGTPFHHTLQIYPRELQPHLQGLWAFDRVLKEMLFRPNPGVKKQQQGLAMRNWSQALSESVDSGYSANVYHRAILHTAKIWDISGRTFEKLAEAGLIDHNELQETRSSWQKHLESIAKRQTDMIAPVLSLQSLPAKTRLRRLLKIGETLERLRLLGDERSSRIAALFPVTDLKKFGYGRKDLKNHVVNDAWKNLIESYLREMESELGSVKQKPHFSPLSQVPLEVLTQTYENLIADIRRKDYDLFARQPSLGLGLRLRHYLPALGGLLR